MLVAQTNIALYEQMKEYGYSLDDIILMKRAYDFALAARSVSLRGSGKPFICHLVGTASLMVQLKQPINYCVASLLHAMYLRGSDLGIGINSRGRRFIVKEAFGEEVEQIVYAYHKLKWRYSEEQISELMSGACSSGVEKIVLMKLCNEAEDFLDNAVLYMGGSDSGKKSTAWRLEYMKNAQGRFRSVCDHLGAKALGDYIDSLINRSLESKPVPALQTGYNKSYSNTGPSVRDQRAAAFTKVFRPQYYRSLMLNWKGSRYAKKNT